MNTKNKLTWAAYTLSAFAAITTSTPVYSQEINNILRTILGNNTGYQNYSQSNNFSAPSAAQSQTLLNLDSRRLQLKNQVMQAVSARRISGQDANLLDTRLNSNANLQNVYSSDGNFTFAEAQSCLNALNEIDVSVQASIAAYPAFGDNNNIANFGNGQRNNGRWNGKLGNSPSSIDRLQAEILNRMNIGRADRRLTNAEYANLMREYDSIAQSETGFSPKQRINTQRRLAQLDASVTQQLSNGTRAGHGSRINYQSDYTWR